MSDIEPSYPWLQASWSQLCQYIEQDRIPQALLLVGNSGIGKQVLASYFSQSVLCESPLSSDGYCGTCQRCLLFAAETHPDYLFIEPSEPNKAIGISVIRELTVTLSLKPQYEGYRMVVINHADQLSHASANAFLKYLEEPTERTCLILIADKPNKLPATIRSRCQMVVIPRVVNHDVLLSWWEQHGILENQALLLKLSQGVPLLAKKFAKGHLLADRQLYFSQWLKLAQHEESYLLMAEKWSKLGAAELDLLLTWLISWAVDMIKLSATGQTSGVHNIDLLVGLKEAAVKLELKSIYQYYDLLLLSQKRLDVSLNKQLILEEVLIRWVLLNSR